MLANNTAVMSLQQILIVWNAILYCTLLNGSCCQLKIGMCYGTLCILYLVSKPLSFMIARIMPCFDCFCIYRIACSLKKKKPRKSSYDLSTLSSLAFINYETFITISV